MRHQTGKIRLIGPGGSGKSTVGTLLAKHLGLAFLDLDRHFASNIGDIGEYLDLHGYDAYARENVAAYCSLQRGGGCPRVEALSSGFMTYTSGVHPEYPRIRREIEVHPGTFVLLPSLDCDLCVAETVRRQIARPFARTPAREEAVIRDRFEVYMAMPARKIVTMRPLTEVIEEIAAAMAIRPRELDGERISPAS
jgi:shikimate kinase